MIRQFLMVGVLCVLVAVVAACGTRAIPPYEADSTAVSVARTETREALLTQGAIVPTDTPTITPSPTVDFAATDAVIQATDDALATLTAEFEATSVAEEAAANEQATVDAEATNVQATADAQVAQPGSDDPLFDEIAAADPANGESLFVTNGFTPCNTCHLVDSEDMLVGPGQLNVLQRTIDRLEDGTIEAEGPYSYLYTSIVNPGEYITEGFANAMPVGYGDFLTDDEIYDLIAYLATLHD